jgi:hypothetical protein
MACDRFRLIIGIESNNLETKLILKLPRVRDSWFSSILNSSHQPWTNCMNSHVLLAGLKFY